MSLTFCIIVKCLDLCLIKVVFKTPSDLLKKLKVLVSSFPKTTYLGGYYYCLNLCEVLVPYHKNDNKSRQSIDGVSFADRRPTQPAELLQRDPQPKEAGRQARGARKHPPNQPEYQHWQTKRSPHFGPGRLARNVHEAVAWLAEERLLLHRQAGLRRLVRAIPPVSDVQDEFYHHEGAGLLRLDEGGRFG